jgi:HEPN domain-containing protein
MFRARKQPVYDAVCFHAQQCAEKYLKAYLQEHNQNVPKVHRLLDLLKLAQVVDSSLEILLPDLKELERFAVNFRYPGMTADKDEARIAFKAAQIVRKFLREQLRIS